jgi:hypothetical protein
MRKLPWLQPAPAWAPGRPAPKCPWPDGAGIPSRRYVPPGQALIRRLQSPEAHKKSSLPNNNIIPNHGIVIRVTNIPHRQPVTAHVEEIPYANAADFYNKLIAIFFLQNISYFFLPVLKHSAGPKSGDGIMRGIGCVPGNSHGFSAPYGLHRPTCQDRAPVTHGSGLLIFL